MNLNDRPLAPEPYELLPPVPAFELKSATFTQRAELPRLVVATGEDISPQLEWAGFPPQTKSFLINCFDPDAPTPAGFWHWTIIDVPAHIHHLPEGAGASDALLPAGFHLRNDGGTNRYTGPNPPSGDRPHRYFFAVHALDVESLGLGADATPTVAAFQALFHTIARAELVGTFQQ